MPRVIISSGHTSKDPGSKANGLIEYELARKIAKGILPILRHHGIITLSVPPDLELLKRIEWINNTGYNDTTNDVAIEVHINEGNKRGIETWFEGEGESKSKQLSEILLRTVSVESSLPKQGSKSEYDHEIGSIAFLHDVNAITTLVECGYIDNTEDAGFLKNDNNIAKLSRGIAKGLLEYFGVQYREQGVPSPIQSTPIQKPTPPITQTTVVDNPNPAPNYQSMPPRPTMTNNNFGGGNMGAFQRPMSPMNDFQQGGYPQQGGFPGEQNFNAPQTMSRDERKKMIDDMYVKVLGREPNQNDQNYFLNIGIGEQELMKKMIESQEHADLVKSRQEVVKAKEELNEHKTELFQLRASSEDQKVIIRNLHALIAQKNQAIAQLQQQLGMMSNYQNSTKSSGPQQATESPAHKYKGTFLDKLFKAFSDLFE